MTLSLATGEGVTIEEEREEQERIAAEEAAKKGSQDDRSYYGTEQCRDSIYR